MFFKDFDTTDILFTFDRINTGWDIPQPMPVAWVICSMFCKHEARSKLLVSIWTSCLQNMKQITHAIT